MLQQNNNTSPSILRLMSLLNTPSLPAFLFHWKTEIRAGFHPLRCLAPGFLPLEWRHLSNCVNYLWELLEYDHNCEMFYVPWHWQHTCHLLLRLFRTLSLSCLLRYLHGWHYLFIFELGGNHAKGYTGFMYLLHCVYHLAFQAGWQHPLTPCYFRILQIYLGWLAHAFPPPAFPISFVGLIVCEKMTIVSLFPSPGSPTHYWLEFRLASQTKGSCRNVPGS